MASTTTQRRKGPPRSLEGVMTVEPIVGNPSNDMSASTSASTGTTATNANNNVSTMSSAVASSSVTPPVATVRRNKCGTSPFDENWLNVDCCGLFCAGLTYSLHAYGVYAVCLVLLPPWMSTTDDDGVRSLSIFGHIHRLLFTFVAVMAVYAHFKAMTTDPGAVPPDAVPLDEFKNADEETGGTGSAAATGEGTTEQEVKPLRKGKRICRRCNSYKPPRAHHCSVCRRCIIKMDHHCPWVNNCVGIGNHKYFLLFVFYTAMSCLYSVVLVVIRFMSCMHRHGHAAGAGADHHHHFTCLDRPTQLLSILGLIVEAVLFGMFTCCMMVDQAGVVNSNMTHIDRLKGGVGALMMDSGMRPSTAGIIEVFGLSSSMNHPKRGGSSGVGGINTSAGTRFRFDWLSPFAKACFPPSLRDEIMGFCRPCLGGGNKNNNNTSNNQGSIDTELSSSVLRTSQTGGSQMVRSVAEIV